MLEGAGKLYWKVGWCSKGRTLSPGKPDAKFEVGAVQGPQLQFGEESIAMSQGHEDIEAGFDVTIPTSNARVDDINIEGWSGPDIGFP